MSHGGSRALKVTSVVPAVILEELLGADAETRDAVRINTAPGAPVLRLSRQANDDGDRADLADETRARSLTRGQRHDVRGYRAVGF